MDNFKYHTITRLSSAFALFPSAFALFPKAINSIPQLHSSVRLSVYQESVAQYMFCDIRGVQGEELQLVDNKLESYQEPNYNINI